MWVDIAVLVVLAIFALLGYFRGLFSQAWSLGALVVSFLGAHPVFEFLHTRFGFGSKDSLLGPWVLTLATGACLYVGLLIIGYIIEKLLIERFKLISAGNRLLGGVLGLIKGGVGIVVVLWLVSYFVIVTGTRESELKTQLTTSRVAGVVTRYNPMDLLLLAMVRPYLPVAGSTHPPVAIPDSIKKKYPAFEELVGDEAFRAACDSRDYVAILKNKHFQAFARNKDLLEALEKGQH